MPEWSAPPTRASRVWTSTRKPSGPHHDSKPFLVVHSSHSSSTRAWYVRSTTTFGLTGDLLLSFICVSPCAWFSGSSVVPRARLRSGRDALPTNCGTSRATRQARGKAPPSESRGAAAHPPASRRSPLRGGCVDGARRRTGGFRHARRCRRPASRRAEGLRRQGGAWGRTEPGRDLYACQCICISMHEMAVKRLVSGLRRPQFLTATAPAYLASGRSDGHGTSLRPASRRSHEHRHTRHLHRARRHGCSDGAQPRFRHFPSHAGVGLRLACRACRHL